MHVLCKFFPNTIDAVAAATRLFPGPASRPSLVRLITCFLPSSSPTCPSPYVRLQLKRLRSYRKPAEAGAANHDLSLPTASDHKPSAASHGPAL